MTRLRLYDDYSGWNRSQEENWNITSTIFPIWPDAGGEYSVPILVTTVQSVHQCPISPKLQYCVNTQLFHAKVESENTISAMFDKCDLE